mmetsp:Transcript_12903/g.25854  ORF Transcript_12903/g.25854 Transcript_12903/m.25854 type:complete len:206 (+) Transcript_12903:1192-1809(+)
MKGRRSTSKSLLSQAVSDSCLQYQDTPVLQQGKVSTDVGEDENKVGKAGHDAIGVSMSDRRTVLGATPTACAVEEEEEEEEEEFAEEHPALNQRNASGMQELERLLASSIPESTPPSQNMLGSPPKRDTGAANPLSHCSSWTRMAPISSISNLEMLEKVQHEEEEREEAHVKKSCAIPVPGGMSRCSSGVHWVPSSSSPEGRVLV